MEPVLVKSRLVVCPLAGSSGELLAGLAGDHRNNLYRFAILGEQAMFDG